MARGFTSNARICALICALIYALMAITWAGGAWARPERGLAAAAVPGSPFPPLRLAAAESGATAGTAPAFIDERGVETPGPSRGKTILLSALVPGLGQLLHGHRTTGTTFLLGEVASWTGFIVFREQGNIRKDRYVEYAERFAGVEEASGQSNAYYGFLARYDRSGEPGGPDSYNEIEVRMRAVRELHPNDPAAQERYIRENSISGARAWDWESEERRFDYADLRIASETAYHRSDYAVGGLVAGRILSLMHAIWMTSEEAKVEVGARPAVEPFADGSLARGEGRIGVRRSF